MFTSYNSLDPIKLFAILLYNIVNIYETEDATGQRRQTKSSGKNGSWKKGLTQKIQQLIKQEQFSKVFKTNLKQTQHSTLNQTLASSSFLKLDQNQWLKIVNFPSHRFIGC